MIIDFLIPIAHAAEEAAHATAEAGPAALFGLDWKLFLAQLINFGIILFVLWKWVFKPVAKGLADRTTKIEKSLEDADRITAERETFDTWKNKEISGVRQEASEIISQAKQDAEAVKADITASAKVESEKIMERGKTQLEDEKNKMMTEVKSEIADMVVSAAEAILKQKIDPKTDKALIDQALASIKK